MDRSELYSRDSSPAGSLYSHDATDLFPFEFIEQAAPQIEQQVEDEDEMDFFLFAHTPGQAKSEPQVSRIRLRSPTPTDAKPGLENPHRDRSYYFTQPPTLEELQRFEFAAVSGHDVKAQSCSFCPGSLYAWKVHHIRATKSQALVLANASSIYDSLLQKSSKRKRPGKQARIKTRTKRAEAKAAQEQHQKAAELKEVADREKRTRRNREKKAKKKSREKAKKASGAVQDDDNNSDDDDDGGDGMSSQPG